MARHLLPDEKVKVVASSKWTSPDLMGMQGIVTRVYAIKPMPSIRPLAMAEVRFHDLVLLVRCKDLERIK